MIMFLELVLFAGVWAYIFVPYFLDDPAPPSAPPAGGRKKKP